MNKPRLSVTLSNDNYAKLDTYARMMGMTKSSLAAYGLAQYLFSLDKTMEAVNRFPEVATGQISLVQAMGNLVEDDEKKNPSEAS